MKKILWLFLFLMLVSFPASAATEKKKPEPKVVSKIFEVYSNGLGIFEVRVRHDFVNVPFGWKWVFIRHRLNEKVLDVGYVRNRIEGVHRAYSVLETKNTPKRKIEFLLCDKIKYFSGEEDGCKQFGSFELSEKTLKKLKTYKAKSNRVKLIFE